MKRFRNSQFVIHRSSLFLGILLLGMTACRSEQRPADFVDPEVMASFMADLYLVEGYYAIESQYRFDDAPPELLAAIDGLLEKHHLTRETVEHNLDYYSEHPEKYGALQQRIQQIIEQRNGLPPADAAPSRRHSL